MFLEPYMRTQIFEVGVHKLAACMRILRVSYMFFFTKKSFKLKIKKIGP